MGRKPSSSDEAACPCGGPLPYARCCGRFIDDGLPAPDAERLMRSRYTAYVLGRETYLLATWHPETRPASLDLDAAQAPKWLGLKVLEVTRDGPDRAMVRFVARYKLGGRAFRLEEASRFHRLDGRWHYLYGESRDA